MSSASSRSAAKLVNEPRRRGRPRDADVDRRILESTLRALAHDGFAAMSMEAVSETAGVSKPTIYRRWSSKIELAVAAIATMAVDDPPTDEPDVWKALLTEIELFHRAVSRDQGISIIGTLLAHEKQQPAMIAIYRDQVARARRNRVRAVLHSGIDTGQLPHDFDVNLAVNMMFGFYYASHIGGDPQPPDWPSSAVDVIRRSVASPQRPARARPAPSTTTTSAAVPGNRQRTHPRDRPVSPG
jgi:AcrR family transcriptional regulator